MIGDPVRHSLSPAIHNAAFAATGLDWVFVAFEVPRGDAAGAVAAMRTLGLGGLSVTMPHKEAVVESLDALSNDARRLGAVNCIAREDGGRLVGENTDGAGFLGLLGDAGVDPSGARCVVLGAGGAARAVVLALAGAGAVEVTVAARDRGRAAEAADLAGAAAATVELSAAGPVVAGADLVVNATPLGMDPGDPLPVDARHLGAGVVVELIYHPRRTALMEAATAAGAQVLGGLPMLVHQAAAAFELWTGTAAPLEAMHAAADAKG